MKVRAKAPGQYSGSFKNIGDVFEVDEQFFLDMNHHGENIDPEHSKKFQWLEKVEEPKAVEAKNDRREEERDPAESDQHVAEKKGWA